MQSQYVKILPLTLHILLWLWFLATALHLSRWDLRERRLPNRIVISTLLVSMTGFTILTILNHSWDQFLRAVICACAAVAIYLVLHIAGGMGMGDVKYSAVTGLYLGWLGWEFLWWGTFTAFAAAAVVVIVAKVRQLKIDRLPFGPFMALGVVLIVPMTVL